MTDDLELLLAVMPPPIRHALEEREGAEPLIEVVLDLGRLPEARLPDHGLDLSPEPVNREDIAYVVDRVGRFGKDNRAGIERTLHRISAMRNRVGDVVGLTCRVGRAVFGTVDILRDVVERGRSILLLGRPGVGKTTLLREAARVLADELGKRVIVLDASSEIAGDGDIPHPGIGRARRMQVCTPSLQHEVMIEAVENHMPQVIVIDEIGTELEAAAARTIAERGVQLIGTAHGNNLDNLMLNPTLSDLIGGIQSVTLGDEEARRRRTQKSVLERKAPPTFDVIIEIQDREKVLVHGDVSDTVDALLRGDAIAPELRWRDDGGVHRSQARPRPSPREQLGPDRFAGLVGAGGSGWRTEPGWRGDGGGRGGYGGNLILPANDRGTRPGFRPGASGSWRPGRGTPGSTPGGGRGGSGAAARRAPTTLDEPPEAPFIAGEIADRGPVERGTTVAPEPRARESRELTRQKEWRDSASKAIVELKVEEGTAPVNADELEPGDDGGTQLILENGEDGTIRIADVDALPTLRVLPQGISRKRLEQAVRELQLPVIVAHDVDEADVVMTLRNEYKQKTPMIREAEDRALPIYVLKANSVPQMEASLTSIFALELDPRDAAMRETEDAIGVVIQRSEPVELSPQNA